MEDNEAPKTVKLREKQVTDSLSISYRLYREYELARCFYSVSVSIAKSGETAVARDIASDPETAELVLDLLYRGGVTPCCTLEIVEDIIATVL